jgi:hypothetical protein
MMAMRVESVITSPRENPSNTFTTTKCISMKAPVLGCEGTGIYDNITENHGGL